MNVYKIEAMIIDFDGLGEDEVKNVIENTKYPNWCISPSVTAIETRVVEWSDDHPLNITATSHEAFKKLFMGEFS